VYATSPKSEARFNKAIQVNMHLGFDHFGLDILNDMILWPGFYVQLCTYSYSEFLCSGSEGSVPDFLHSWQWTFPGLREGDGAKQ
jgi:hypothetical protein